MSLLEDETLESTSQDADEIERTLTDVIPDAGGGGYPRSTTGTLPRERGNKCTEPIMNGIDRAQHWYAVLSQVMGRHFLYGLAIGQFVIKGFLAGGGTGGFIGTAMSFLYRDMGVDAVRMQSLRAVAVTPWSIKPLMGITSDLIPLFGRHKLPYLGLFSALAILAYSIIVFIQPESENITTLCLFFAFMQVMVVDLLTEAKYAEKLKRYPDHGPDLMSFVWGGIFGVSILSYIVVGLLLEFVHVRWCYAFAIPLAATMYFPVRHNWIEDMSVTTRVVMFQWEKFHAERELILLSVFVGCTSLLINALSINDVPQGVVFGAIVVLSLLVIASFVKFLPTIIWKAQLFFFLQHMSTVSIESAAFYFFTDDETQYPGGPHFSAFFYTTVLGVVGAVFSLVGVGLYNKWMKKWKYRSVFVVTNLLYCAVNLINIVCFKRWNVAMGIPDTVFILGADAFQLVVQQFTWLPGIVILSQLCPDGVEATMYALLAGTSNLGANIAMHLGSYLLEWLDCNPSGQPNETEQFRNLWLGALISSLGPLIPLLAVNFLIPDAYQTDKLLASPVGGGGLEMDAVGDAAYGRLRDSSCFSMAADDDSNKQTSLLQRMDRSGNGGDDEEERGEEDDLIVVNLDEDDLNSLLPVGGGI